MAKRKSKSKGKKAPAKAASIPTVIPAAPPKKEKPKIVEKVKAAVTRKRRPQAYNIQTEDGTPVNVEQENKRTIFFTGPNVWNVPRTRRRRHYWRISWPALVEDMR